MVSIEKLNELLLEQLAYFESDEQRYAFGSFVVEPVPVEQRWSYGNQGHTCFVIARGEAEQIVYCPTGFGPAFPWSLQPLGAADLGTDGQWNAYLYESFVGSTMWPQGKPANLELCAPGERAET
jgi:hypothetical protein